MKKLIENVISTMWVMAALIVFMGCSQKMPAKSIGPQDKEADLRVSSRNGSLSDSRNSDFGLRLAR